MKTHHLEALKTVAHSMGMDGIRDFSLKGRVHINTLRYLEKQGYIKPTEGDPSIYGYEITDEGREAIWLFDEIDGQWVWDMLMEMHKAVKAFKVFMDKGDYATVQMWEARHRLFDLLAQQEAEIERRGD